MKGIKFRAFWNEKKKMDYEPYGDEFTCEGTPVNALFTGWPFGDGTATLMQYTGLKDKNGDKDIYEYDIIDKEGLIIGNKYETPSLLKDTTNLLIEGFGEEGWTTTNKEAMERGCYYTKRYANKDELQDVEQLHKGGRL